MGWQGAIEENSQRPEGMSQYRVSAAAKTDLDEIWFYIAQDTPDAADKFIRAFVARFPWMASMPEMGRRREELARRIPSGARRNRFIRGLRPFAQASNSEGATSIRLLISGGRLVAFIAPLFSS